MSKLLDKKDHGVSQLISSKNEWAKELWARACANHWMPQEVNMSEDIKQWKDTKLFTDDERLLVKRALGLFAAGESLVSNSIETGEWPYITDGACRQYMIRKNFEECLVEGTEVLTPVGWKKIEDVKCGEKVYQFNMDDGSGEFAEVEKTHKYSAPDHLIRFYNDRGLNILVTPNHRMVRMRFETKKFDFCPAHSVTYNKYELPIACPKKDGDVHSLTPKERFLIAFQADGNQNLEPIRDGSRNGGLFMKSFHLTRPRKKERMEKLLADTGYKHKRTDNDDGSSIYWVWVNFDTPKNFNWVNLERVSQKWCDEFVNELSAWDGYTDEECGRKGYDSTNKSAADMAQAIGLLWGNRSNMSIDPDPRKESYSDLYRVFWPKDKKNWGRNCVKKEVIKNDKPVYCLTIPSGAFLCRYNNKAFVTGNSIHNWTVKICCEAYNLNVDEVAEAYKNIPTIKAKERFLMESLSNFKDKNFDIDTVDSKQKFLKNMVVFYLICEGTSLGRQNKLPGLMDQLSYTLKDEATHVEFGSKVLEQTQDEYPEVWTAEYKEEIRSIIKKGAEIEFDYAKDVLPTGILGVTHDMLVQYIKYLANARASSIGLKSVFEEVKNPFTWLDETQNASKMTAFFERRNKDYQQASALTDDL
jgi:ribonucleotide reductase beta subunit family protein with ferritin-like domain